MNPYLDSNSDTLNPYTEGMRATVDTLTPFVPSKKLLQFEQKLQLEGKSFTEPQYLQSACELSVCAYFAGQYPATFEYEPVVTAPKDVDCAFVDNGFRFNVEVKCPDFSIKNALDKQPGFQVGIFGRHPERETLLADLAKAVSHDPEGRALLAQPHMDNKLKDFLTSAHGKFADSIDDGTLNVLVVCCDTASDMQKWYGYLYGHEGLFTTSSYHPVSEYARVDAVLLTNLYHRHYNYREKDQLTEHWQLARAFNLLFSNPRRQRDKRDAFLHFLTTFPHQSWELHAYEVEGDAPPEVMAAIKLSTFVADKLADSGMFQMQRAAPADSTKT
ncbi:hypothetical protein [Caballeronia sp. 15711]|uniref:hypothetical protein n=1 Tax=Caballeronia sp. 15711 TaxID=3391029 RepID=UPI0039E62236